MIMKQANLLSIVPRCQLPLEACSPPTEVKTPVDITLPTPIQIAAIMHNMRMGRNLIGIGNMMLKEGSIKGARLELLIPAEKESFIP